MAESEPPTAASGPRAARTGGPPPRTVKLSAPSSAPPERIFRRQLVDLLRRGARGPLTLVSARAGTMHRPD